MARFSRRSFVRGAAAIPFAVWFERFAWAASLVRYDATSAKGKEMLKIYAGAVQAMRTQSLFVEGNPRNWEFQWYTHMVRSNTTKAAELARIYPAPSVWKSLATEMWDTCQSHLGQPENYFLPWHRMFVFYFESIIRKVSGVPTFTLPYWNYSVPAPSPNHGVIPPEFRMEGDPTFGSLYVCKRNTGVNTGTPIDQGQPDTPLSTSALQQCTYGPNGSAQGFCATLDFGLHGNVHVLTGNGQNMGSVPWAAYDPIFWLHHCNIDRLWASWNAAGRKNPTDSTFLNKKFVFADANGIRVEATISNFLSIAPLNYSYEKLEPVTNLCPVLVSPTASAPRELVKQGTPISLAAGAVRATLAAAPSPQATVPLATRIDNLAEGHRLFIVLKNLQTDIQPEVLYHLYLELPGDAPGSASEEYYVGSLNFFAHGHVHEGAPAGGSNADKFRSFDITDLAKRLRAKGKMADKAELTIAPAGTPATEAKPVIGEVSIVEQ